MSEEHNRRPTAGRKLSLYRKTIELNSASQWDSFNLDLFHVDFPPKQQLDLDEVLGREFYQVDPENETDRRTIPLTNH